MDCWKILGINVTTDKKRIKRAYAALAKVYHPEDAPEKFSQIRDAYGEAIAYADRGKKSNRTEQVDQDIHEYVHYKPVDVKKSESKDEFLDADELFNELDDLNMEQMNALYGSVHNEKFFVDSSMLWKSQIAIARQLMKGKNKESIYEWRLFLSSAEFQKVKYNMKFMKQFYRLCFRSNGSRELFDEILKYYKLSEYEAYILEQVKCPVIARDGMVNGRHRLVVKLNNFLLKHDREGRWTRLCAAPKKQWEKMKNTWKIEEWFVLGIFLFVAGLGVGYLFGVLNGTIDMNFRDWIDTIM